MRPDVGKVMLWVLLVFCVSVAMGSGQGSAPFTVHHLLAMKRISDVQASPDGTHMAFVVRTTDLEANQGRTDIWLVGMDGYGLKQLTTSEAADTHPRWSADGRFIWFLSTRSGTSQVWRLPVDGGEAQQMTDLPLDVANLVLSPDNRYLAFTLEVFPECKTVQETKDKLDAREKRKSTGRLYDSIFVRHWDTWKDGRRSHLFVKPVDSDIPVDVMGPRPGQTRGMDADTPSQPFGGSEELTFTPDSRHVLFSARDVGRSEPWSTDFDLYMAPVDGSSTPTCLTEDNEAWDTYPVFSPDGKTLAYLAMTRPGYESDQFEIVLQDWPAGEKTVLTDAWDRSPSSLVFSKDGQSLYATAPNIGQVSLFRIDIKSGDVSTLVKEGSVFGVAVTKDYVVYEQCHLKSPVELYRMDVDGQHPQAVTSINATQLAQVRMGDYEQFSFKGWNEETVYGIVVKPVDFNPSQSYPVAYLIHGGPQGSFNNTFHYRWNPQVYAGAGYAVAMVDFHGSVGYGQAFTDSIRGDWGGKPLEDLQKGLAAALQRYPWMDGQRVGALGASFGGYMINWIAGQWPDRFRCLVNHDGNLDERMAYFATDELWFPEWDHQGTPWTHPEGYELQNPVNYVQNWQTPMLVIHGAHDYRVVDAQGLATFNALQRRGIPSQLLYFPDESHWVLKPHNSIQWHETVIAWLDRWLK